MSAEIAARRNFSRIGATRPRTEIEAAAHASSRCQFRPHRAPD